MSLAPLESVTQQPEGDAEASSQGTFRERTAQRLGDESKPEPGRPEDFQAESAEDAITDDVESEDEYIEEPTDSAGDPEDDDSGALVDELPPEDESEEAEDSETEQTADFWQDKAANLQKELSKVTANRKQIEQDLADGVETNIQTRHQLEDQFNTAQQHAAYYLNIANQAVNQWERQDWANMEPEQKIAAKKQYQSAVAYRDQLGQDFQATQQAATQAMGQVKEREAEVSKAKLKALIPEWSNEHYAKLRDHAVSIGYTPEEFNHVTDWRLINMVHQNWMTNQSIEQVQNVQRKQKAKRPANRNARAPERNAAGRYKKTKEQFQRGEIPARAFFEEKLAAERKQRR